MQNNIGPEIMRSLFNCNNQESRKSFFRPNVESEHNGKESIRYFGPLVWDYMLPNDLKSIKSLEKFKIEIKKWVPENCPCNLCKVYIAGVGYVSIFE